MDSWQEEVYGLFNLFHSARKGGYGPEPLGIGEMHEVLKMRGYREIEEIIGLLISMDLTYRAWWAEENKKDG